MAGSKTDYLENKVLDHALGVAAMTMPTTYLALFTADPGESGDQSNEVSGGGYARVALSGKFGNASGGSSSNTAEIVFPKATADWGTVTHVGVMDASSGGNMLYHIALDTAKTVGADDTLKIEVGGLAISED